MSIKVVAREYPNRVLALTTETHALVFRHTPSAEDVHNGALQSTSLDIGRGLPSTETVSQPRCMVEFAELSSFDMSDFRQLSPLPVRGTLGLITVNNDIFLSVVTRATQVAGIRPNETIQKILAVEFHCLNTSAWDTAILSQDISSPYNEYGQNMQSREPIFDHPCANLQKLWTDTSFYYSTDFDVTNRMQDRYARSEGEYVPC